MSIFFKTDPHKNSAIVSVITSQRVLIIRHQGVHGIVNHKMIYFRKVISVEKDNLLLEISILFFVFADGRIVFCLF